MCVVLAAGDIYIYIYIYTYVRIHTYLTVTYLGFYLYLDGEVKATLGGRLNAIYIYIYIYTHTHIRTHIYTYILHSYMSRLLSIPGW